MPCAGKTVNLRGRGVIPGVASDPSRTTTPKIIGQTKPNTDRGEVWVVSGQVQVPRENWSTCPTSDRSPTRVGRFKKPLFPLELSGLNRFGRVEPPRTHVKLHHRPVFYYGLNRFGRVEPPQTNEKLPYGHCFLWSSVVRGGKVE